MKTSSKFIVALIPFFTFNSLSWAAPEAPANKTEESKDGTDFFKSLDYPELQVVPRASERLRMEALEEQRNWWSVHWPIQISALSTLALGSVARNYRKSGLNGPEKSTADRAFMVTQAIGVGWIAGVLLISYQRPYLTGFKKLPEANSNSKSKELLRERIAEEAMERPAYNFKVLTWTSVLTNFGAAAYLSQQIENEGQVYAGISAIIAFLPLIFKDKYVYNYEKQLQYKRDIFSPVVSWNFNPTADPETQKVSFYPALNLNWTF